MFGVFVWGLKTGYTYVNQSNYKHALTLNRALLHDLQRNNASVSSLEYNVILNYPIAYINEIQCNYKLIRHSALTESYEISCNGFYPKINYIRDKSR